MCAEPPGRHPEQLRSASHCWHLIGATLSAVYLHCCACDYSAIVDATHEGGSWLRFSLMEGPELIGRGLGLLMGDCMSGSRRLSIDGYPVSSCTFVSDDDDEFMREFGMRGMGLVQLPGDR